MHVCCGGGSCADTGDNITITCTCTDRAVSDVSFPTATQREPQPAAHAHRTGGARHSATLQLHSVSAPDRSPHRLVSRECTQGSRVSRSYTVESGVPDWRAERRAFLHLVSGFRLHSRVLRRPCVRPPSYCTHLSFIFGRAFAVCFRYCHTSSLHEVEIYAHCSQDTPVSASASCKLDDDVRWRAHMPWRGSRLRQKPTLNCGLAFTSRAAALRGHPSKP